MTPEPKPTAKALAEKAAKELAAAQAKSDLLGRKSAEADAKFQAEAEGRRQKYMRAWLENEFLQAPEADAAVLASRAAFYEAVQKDPLMQVWLAYVQTSFRTFHNAEISANFASRLGVPAPVCYPLHGTPTFFEVMQGSLERLASRLESSRQADIMDALERAANGDDDGT